MTPEVRDQLVFAKIDTRGGVAACHPWLGALYPAGHPMMTYRSKRTRVHRWLWERAYGAIEAGLVVRHLCHNPRCCNLAHLKLGTQADNMRDMSEAGRWGVRRLPKGEAHPRAKYSDIQVQQVKALLAEGLSRVAVSHKTGVSLASVKAIRAGRRYVP